MKRSAMNERQANRLARVLRDRRAGLGWSMQQLSDASGVNQATIVKLERAELRTPQVYTIRALGQAMGIDTYELFLTAEWLSPGQLPPIGAYLRSKYRDLSDADIEELQRHLQQINRAGDLDGPLNNEDERDSA